MELPFMLPDDEYVRNLNMMQGAIDQSALYLSLKTGRAFDECKEFVLQKVTSSGKLGIEDKKLLTLTKDANRDRVKTTMTFNQYLHTCDKNNLIISPSMTAYYPPSTKKSVAGEYLRAKKKERGKLKEEGALAFQDENYTLADQKHRGQTTAKIKINSYSGASASLGTPLYLKSNHPSLTSPCRCGTAYGTTTIERFAAGNRHLFNEEITLSSIVSAIHLTDEQSFQKCMEVYGLVYPTVTDVVEMIKYSTDLYWTSADGMGRVIDFIQGLTPLHLAITMYTNDMFHIKKLNNDFIRDFLNELSSKGDGIVDDADKWIKEMCGDVKVIVSYICEDELKGTSIKALSTAEDQTGYNIVASTSQRIYGVMESYKPFIQCMFVNGVMPNSIPAAAVAMRRTAVISDTDSTIFTVEKWVEWWNGGEYKNDSKSRAIANTLVFLCGQVVSHQLGMFSTNMGIEKEDLRSFGMKNEFAYPAMLVTNKAKHYASFISACEGNVFKELKYDAKGVTLRSSKIPKEIMNHIESFIQHTMKTFIDGRDISIVTLQRFIAAVEWDIHRSVSNADSKYLIYSKVKKAESYKNPISSPYAQYLLWEEVFAKYYGHAPEPEYAAIKISVDLNSATKIAVFLNSVENVALADDLRKYLVKYNRKGLTQFLIPTDIARRIGIPKELVQACNLRKLIFANCEAFYLVLEAMGCYMHNGSNTRLCMDLYPDENLDTQTVIPTYMDKGSFIRGVVTNT